MTRYAARVDTNHAEIEAAFRKLLGDRVTNSSRWAEGAPDLFVSFGKYCCFCEVKSSAAAKLTPAQVAFRKIHPDVFFRVESIDQAIKLCSYIRFQATKLARE